MVIRICTPHWERDFTKPNDVVAFSQAAATAHVDGINPRGIISHAMKGEPHYDNHIKRFLEAINAKDVLPKAKAINDYVTGVFTPAKQAGDLLKTHCSVLIEIRARLRPGAVAPLATR